MGLIKYAAALGRQSTAWPAPPREPLPPDPPVTVSQPGPPEASCWAKEPYDSTLPAGIPARPDRLFHRGNTIGVRVPGLTEGQSDSARRGPSYNDPTFDVTWSWTRYSDAQMRLACDWHVDGCGYSHTSVSVPHAWNQHGRDWALALAAMKRVADYAHGRGMFIVWPVASGEDETFSVTRPYCDQLVALGAIIPGRDLVIPCWQIDKWHTPVSGIQEIVDVGTWARPYDLPGGPHWGGGYPGWADNCAMWEGPTGNTSSETYLRWGINDRDSFQQALGPSGMNVLQGHYGQCNTEADLGQVQSWIRKAVVAFTPGMFFVYAEGDMQAESDDPFRRLELYGDQKALFAQCTVPNYGIQISSFNGSRGRDGRVLLPV